MHEDGVEHQLEILVMLASVNGLTTGVKDAQVNVDSAR